VISYLRKVLTSRMMAWGEGHPLANGPTQVVQGVTLWL
jgi:hypothetical protein